MPKRQATRVKNVKRHLQGELHSDNIGTRTKSICTRVYHDRTVNVPLFVGDKVLLHDEKVRRGRSSKLSQPWIGPHEVIAVDEVNVTLKLPRNRNLKVHANRLKHFR